MSEAAAFSWRRAAAVYLDRRQILIFAMGFGSGLPLLLTLSTLTYWLGKVGIDKTSIGLMLLTGVPYTWKFLWSPIIDSIDFPILGRVFGRRRGWALATQLPLMAAIVWMGQTDPATDPLPTALAALAVAFFSASQDIVIDAIRIELLTKEEQGAGAAMTQAGYRIGLLVAGAGAIAAADFLPWPTIFFGLAGLMSIGMVAVLLAPEPAAPKRAAVEHFSGWLRMAVIDPFGDFLMRRSWLAIMLFVLLYKFGDAIGGSMANVFYGEMGFSGVEIATITKLFGVIATMAGIFTGGVLVARLGLFGSLLVGGILQALANLMFAVQATVGHDIGVLTASIAIDNFTGGLGSAAFVAYLSALTRRQFTATQYALLSSLFAFGRTVLSSSGGWLAAQLDWAPFFVATTVLAIPGLALLWWLRSFSDSELQTPPKPAPPSPHR